MKREIYAIYIFLHVCLNGFDLWAQQIMVTGTLTLNQGRMVECVLKYSNISGHNKSVLYLDTAYHVCNIRKNRRSRGCRHKLGWNSAFMNHSYSYTTCSGRKKEYGLPHSFIIKYRFVSVPEEEFNAIVFEEALKVTSVRQELLPVLYNEELKAVYDNVKYELYFMEVENAADVRGTRTKGRVNPILYAN